MQGRSEGQRDVFDVESVAGHLLAPGSVFAFLAEHRARLFPAEMFEDLFPSGRGRPSIAPDVVATVIVLQTLHNLSDRETAEAVTFDLRWKAACGIAIDAASFHHTVLTYWRRRLAASGRPERIFEVVRQLVVETGAVANKNRRALDSTILDDAVARQDTVTQLIAAIRRVAREVPGADDVVATLCSGHDYSQPGKPKIAWDDPAARDELVSALVNDAVAVLGALDLRAITDAGGKPADAIALLALVAGQDVEPAEDSDGCDGRWRIARKVAPDRMISTVDPDTRHAHKSREKRQDGFKAHIVIEPDTGLITDTAMTKANGPDNSDATIGAALITTDTTLPAESSAESESTAGPNPSFEVLGDSAYGSGDMLAALDKAGHVAVIKPWPHRPCVEGGFVLDDFTYDPNAADGAGTLTCPAGVTRPLSPNRNVIFGVACRGCPLRDQCTTATKGRTVHVHPHEELMRTHRQRAKDPGWQETYRTHRPMVERSIAWLTRGARRVPYRGVAKNNAWLHHRVAALNLRRLLVLGLAFDNDAWVLG